MSRYNIKVKFYESGEIQIHTFPNGVDFSKSLLENDALDVLPSSSNNNIKYSSAKSYNEYNTIRSLRRTKQTVFNYALNNEWEYFVTFTFDTLFHRYDFDSIRKYMAKWLNNFKCQKCPDLKYIGVPEFHKDGAIHFHFLISNVNKDFLKLSDNQIKYKNQFYCPTFPCRNFWEPVRNSVAAASYMCKYISKDLAATELARSESEAFSTSPDGGNNDNDTTGHQKGAGNGTKARYIRSRNLNLPEERTFFLDSSELPEGIDLATYIQSMYFPEYSVYSVQNGRNDSAFLRLI